MLDFLRLSHTPWGVTAPLPEKVLGGGEAEGAVLASPLWTWVGARDPTPSSPCPVFGHIPSTSSPLPCPHFPGSTAPHRKRPHCHHGNPGGRGPPGMFPVLRRLGGTCQEQGGQAWGYFLDGVPPPDGPSPSPGGGRPQPRLEDEIDFLAQELARKESGHSTPPLPKARQRLPEPGETPASRVPWPCPQPSALALTCPLSQPPWASQHGDRGWSWASPPLQEPPCPRPTPPWAPLCHPSQCTCHPWSPGEGTATASPLVGLGRGWAGAAGPPAEAALTRPLPQC